MMERYVALLRGINSGSNPSLKMETLRKIFEGMGFNSVRTVLASGNVVFENDRLDPSSLEATLENGLEKDLGYKVVAIVKSPVDIEKLVKSNPFGGLDLTPQTRLYITFFKGAATVDPTISDTGKAFKILRSDHDSVRSTVDLNRGTTVELMEFLDKTLGKKNTTRNWNTIEKIYSKIL